MRPLTMLVALLGTAQAAPRVTSIIKRALTKEGYTIVDPQPGHVVPGINNTLNGTYYSDKTRVMKPTSIPNHLAVDKATTGPLTLALQNNLGDGVNAYITGKDAESKVVIIGADGSLIYPSSGGSKVPVAVTEDIKIPIGALHTTTNVPITAAIESARIYFCVGELSFAMVLNGVGDDTLVEPSVASTTDASASLDWGIVEWTYNADSSIYANISYVDFVGLILSMQLDNTDGSTQLTKGLGAGAVQAICDGLRAQQQSDGFPWAASCLSRPDGTGLRVLAPQDYMAVDPDAFSTYWDDYISQVWTKYTSQPLKVNTQSAAGVVDCQVSGDVMNCAGDTRPFAKPVGKDIWGCNSGPFGVQEGDSDLHKAVVPRLCAAFTRSTLLLNGGGDTQPSVASTSYYTTSPTSHYSRLVHANEVDGKGYAFAYDDVNPADENASGTLSSGNPKTLTIYIGGYQG